ncbi:MAG: precorrin-6Y C5,15-methyltransferase (decarboxylating) subunit CbiT [Nitrosopumilaceae archaeon]|nr:precorrin-6Y C5,15-methyltransferase (decarboxylating) subunit CbiT [Nitrosopumilaceae archaeon]
MPGIPDEYFERSDSVPITKEEVRAIIISKARLKDGGRVLDVGCGSGSITVEAAIHAAGNGLVTAIDRDGEAVALTERNLERFGVRGYAGVVRGDALDVLGGTGGGADGSPPHASPYDAIIIGGTGGDTAEIVERCSRMLEPGGRIVISTILIETLHSVLGIMDRMPFEDVDITQVTISKSRKTSTGTMMLARNPVTVISATRAK